MGDRSFLSLQLRGLSCQPLGLEPLAIVGKRLLRDVVLSHCLSGINLAKCLARIALRFGDPLGCGFKLARCLCHFFAFSPAAADADSRIAFSRSLGVDSRVLLESLTSGFLFCR